MLRATVASTLTSIESYHGRLPSNTCIRHGTPEWVLDSSQIVLATSFKSQAFSLESTDATASFTETANSTASLYGRYSPVALSDLLKNTTSNRILRLAVVRQVLANTYCYVSVLRQMI
jgi:hypothetical protein